MTVTTKPLSETVGAEVIGVDRDRLLTDDDLVENCLEALDPNGALVFPGLHLDDTTQVAFSQAARRVEGVVRQGRGTPRSSGSPSTPSREPSAAYLKGTFDWHIDGMTVDIPIMATVLSAHAGRGRVEERPSSPAGTRRTRRWPTRRRSGRWSGSSTRSRPRSGCHNPDPAA